MICSIEGAQYAIRQSRKSKQMRFKSKDIMQQLSLCNFMLITLYIHNNIIIIFSCDQILVQLTESVFNLSNNNYLS